MGRRLVVLQGRVGGVVGVMVGAAAAWGPRGRRAAGSSGRRDLGHGAVWEGVDWPTFEGWGGGRKEGGGWGGVGGGGKPEGPWQNWRWGWGSGAWSGCIEPAKA